MSWFNRVFRSREDAPLTSIEPPFPPLVRNVFGSDKSLFYWEGAVRLCSWTGFAKEQELTPDGWSSGEPEPDGVLKLSIQPVNTAAASQPTEQQARAFQHLLDNEKAVLDAVLRGIFESYGPWRQSHFAAQISRDGGKTYQTAGAFPELYRPEDMPEISAPAGLICLIRPNTVHILESSRGGFAEVGFQFSCKWDEEHGLGVLTNKGVVLQVGDCTASLEH